MDLHLVIHWQNVTGADLHNMQTCTQFITSAKAFCKYINNIFFLPSLPPPFYVCMFVRLENVHSGQVAFSNTLVLSFFFHIDQSILFTT